MTNLIGFVGKAQQGKSISAKIWQAIDVRYNFDNVHQSDDKLIEFVLDWIDTEAYKKMYNTSVWKQKSFAHKLKEIGAIICDCNIKDFENAEFKEELCSVYYPELYTHRQILCQIADMFKYKCPGIWDRLLWKEYHTSPYKWNSGSYTNTCSICGKEFIGHKMQRICKHCCSTAYSKDFWLITDVRYLLEAQSVKDRGGKLIRVKKSDYNPVLEATKFAEQQMYELYDGCDDLFEACNDETLHPLSNIKECYQRDFNYFYDQYFTNQHSSETEQDEIKVDYEIVWDNIEELIKQIKDIMIKEGAISDI